MNFELVDLGLKRVEVDLFEPPLAWGAYGKREGGFWVGRDCDVPALWLLGRRVGSGTEFFCLESGGGELLDGKLHAGKRSCSCSQGRCGWRSGVGVIEVDVTGSGCKDGMIFADGCIGPWVPGGTTLPVDDLAGVHNLTC